MCVLFRRHQLHTVLHLNGIGWSWDAVQLAERCFKLIVLSFKVDTHPLCVSSPERLIYLLALDHCTFCSQDHYKLGSLVHCQLCLY